MSDIAIKVEHVNKVYKLYDRPLDRFKEALGLSRNKKYKEHYALNDVSFDIYKGETIGIIGTNGSGKSTILKIITGVLNQNGGNVKVSGRISALLELGTGFNMEYTGVENIFLNGTMMGYTREQMEERVDKIADFAGIGEYINQPVKTYSSGMFARLAFAVAINVDPDILIVDEALSVGDIYFQAKCFKKMDEIKKSGTTVLIVSHDLSSIAKYCDRVILLNKGQKVKEGSPKEMIDIYKKIMVNQYNEDDDDNNYSVDDEETSNDIWKNSLTINEENILYGNKKVSIEDFGIFDSDGNITNIILKKSKYTIKMRVNILEDVENPIFAFTIKNVRGVEITGTNTMFEKKDVELAKAGETYVISFTQDMMLQGGEYLLSLGCTGFESDGFVVYQRLYDITEITVISEQDTVGTYDCNSVVKVEKLG